MIKRPLAYASLIALLPAAAACGAENGEAESAQATTGSATPETMQQEKTQQAPTRNDGTGQAGTPNEGSVDDATGYYRWWSTDIAGTDGRTMGTLKLRRTEQGVLLNVEVQGLAPGEHGFHIHETGTCDTETDFSSAGGHYQPRDQSHGFLEEGGHHAGDMANLVAGADGVARAERHNVMVTLDGERAPLLDEDGSALIIHEGADDYTSQPSGDAGPRAACAEITVRSLGMPA